MDCIVRQEKTGNRLTDVHIEDFTRVSHLYDEQDPKNPATFARRADMVSSWFSTAKRQALVDALKPYLLQIGASTKSLAEVERLRDERAVAIVTGQQAGLFTGPLYAISKALSAIGLARTLETELDRPVIPVFWIASEDHDFAEVNHAYMLDDMDNVQRVVLGVRPEPHQMVYHTPLTESTVTTVLQQVYDILPDGPYKLDMLETLKSAWQPDDSLSTWFARLMAVLFQQHGLVFLDPCLPALRGLITPVWEQAILAHKTVQEQLNQAYQEVVDHGFEPEVIRDSANTTLFYVKDGERYVMEAVDGETLRVRGLNVEKSLSEWVQLAREDPTSFSSNVLLRPVVQDHLLPTLAYVGGPSELAYYPLSRAVFHAHGRTLPPLIMRQRMTVYPPTVTRHMKHWNLGIDDVGKASELVQSFLASQGAKDIEHELTELSQAVQSGWASWASAHEDLGPQVGEMVGAQLKRTRLSIERMQRRTIRLLEQRLSADVGQLRHIERWLWTNGHPQERRLCPLNIWANFGVACLQQLPTWGDYLNPAPMYHIHL